jgi:nucleotide-binding universal stress UspA family protein
MQLMNKIIACIDGSRSSPFVCDYAAWAARRLEAPLTMLHVTDNPHAKQRIDMSGNLSLGSREHLLDEMVELEEARGKLVREQGKAILSDAIARVREHGIDEVGRLLRHGSLTEVLGGMQDEMRMAVLGKQGKDGDMIARHIGSHLENIIRTLDRPILVSPLSYREPERFMIAYDGSATADKVVERVARSPLLKGLPVHVLMVGEDNAANQDRIDNARATLAQDGFEVQARIQSGEIEDTVCDYRKEHDMHLMAMGAYGHSRIRQFFVGSTTTKMIMKSPMPLVILR